MLFKVHQRVIICLHFPHFHVLTTEFLEREWYPWCISEDAEPMEVKWVVQDFKARRETFFMPRI